MRKTATLITAGVLATLAAPAAAQYYPAPAYPAPGTPYPAPGYGYGAPLDNGLLNRFAVNDRQAITQCVGAAQAQFGNGYRNNAYAANQWGQRWTYNPTYRPNARVTAVTNVDRRNWGVKINGLMSSGLPYGAGVNPTNPLSDLSFRCDVNRNGAVTNLRVNRIQPRPTLGY